VALAAALAIGCGIIVIDEALNMLDRPMRQSIRSLLSSLRAIPGLAMIEFSDLRTLSPRTGSCSFRRNYFSTERPDFLCGQTEAAGRLWPAALRAKVPAGRRLPGILVIIQTLFLLTEHDQEVTVISSEKFEQKLSGV
jgi:hypothetical protein